MAHKKAGGSSRNGRDSKGQRRGVKKYGGELVQPGNILVRQVGSNFHAGDNVGTGKDYTLFALKEGHVKIPIPLHNGSTLEEITLLGVFFFGVAPDIMQTEGDQWIDCISDNSCVEQRL